MQLCISLIVDYVFLKSQIFESSGGEATKYFLLVAVVGLTPIALSYGYAPVISLNYLFEIDASPINDYVSSRCDGVVLGIGVILGASAHLGAKKHDYQRLYSLRFSCWVWLLVESLGLVLELLRPYWLLFIYLVLELGFGLVGLKNDS